MFCFYSRGFLRLMMDRIIVGIDVYVELFLLYIVDDYVYVMF